MIQFLPIALLWCCLSLLVSPSLNAAEVIGTIAARLDGKARTWYVLQPEGGSQMSALWMARGPDTGQAVITGFESKNISFSMDPVTGIMNPSGEGSAITISFRFPMGTPDVDHRLPATGDDPAAIVLQPVIGDSAKMLGLDEGRVQVTVIDASKGGRPAGFAGSFSGRLQGLKGDTAMELVNGKFEVDGIRFFNPE